MLTGTVLYTSHGFVHPSIQVVESAKVRYLRFGTGGGWQGALDLRRPERPVFPYQRAFSTVVSALPSVHRYLSVGVGIGTSLRVVRKHFPNTEAHGVELDETVLDIAVNYFDAPPHDTVQYWVGDGVQFLGRGQQAPYDLIFVDAFMSNRIYSPAVEPSFGHVLAQSVGPDGVVVINLITSIPLRGKMKTFMDAMARNFSEVWLMPVGMPFLEQNILAVCYKSRSLVPDWTKTVYKVPELTVVERTLWPWRVRRYVIY